MIHQHMTEISGQATDIKIHATEVLKLKKKLNEILAKDTKKPFSQVENDTERDFFMTSNESLKYGIIDKVIEGQKTKPSKNKEVPQKKKLEPELMTGVK